MSARNGFELGEYRINPQSREIVGPRGPVRVEPKAMDVLLRLAEATGETVDRETLIRSVWPRGFVTDDVLTRCIGQIRKALGETARASRFVVTVPKVGYRLAGRTSTRDPGSPPLRPGLLVLPFQSLSPDPQDAYLAGAMTELLIASLASIKSLRIISRTTAVALGRGPGTLPEIAEQVDARWVVEGSVMVVGDQLKLVTQLIDAPNDEHVWAETRTCQFHELLQLEREIARHIARAACGHLPEARPEVSLSGVELRRYLHARMLKAHRSTDKLNQAIEEFSSITRQKPDFAPAWASLGEIYLMLAHYGAMSAATAIPLINDHVRRALSLEPDLGIGLACLGGLKLFFERDLSGAEEVTLQALDRQPSYEMALMTMANIVAVQGRSSEAMDWARQALSVDPLNVGINMNLADHHILAGDGVAAASQLERTLAISPDHLPSRHRLAWALALAGDHQTAQETLEAVPEAARSTEAHQEYRALVAGLAGRAGDALNAFTALRGKGNANPWQLARAAAAAEQVDTAFDCLDRALAANSSSIIFAAVTPALKSLHPDRRWPRLMKRIGLK